LGVGAIVGVRVGRGNGVRCVGRTNGVSVGRGVGRANVAVAVRVIVGGNTVGDGGRRVAVAGTRVAVGWTVGGMRVAVGRGWASLGLAIAHVQ
jgi:hypothetical protein